MIDKQTLHNMSGFRDFCTHTELLGIVNEQREILNGHFEGDPEVYKVLLAENNCLRDALINFMLDDSLMHHPITIMAEAKDELYYLERVWDLAEVHSDEEFAELTELLWTHWTSDDEEESNQAKEKIEKQFLNPNRKYAFVLSEDSRGLDDKGLFLLEQYINDEYDADVEPIFIEDDIIQDPSYLAEKMAGEFRIGNQILGAEDCYVFVLHNNKHDMECITGPEQLYSFVKTLLLNQDKQSWEVAVMFAMSAGISPISIDGLAEDYQ